MLLSILTLFCLTGCGESSDNTVTDIPNLGGFTKIDGQSNLYYYNDTRIVYIIGYSSGSVYKGYGFMSEYYSENGLICKYINNKIVEINNKDVVINNTTSNPKPDNKDVITMTKKEIQEKTVAGEFETVPNEEGLYYNVGSKVVYKLVDCDFLMYNDPDTGNYYCYSVTDNKLKVLSIE